MNPLKISAPKGTKYLSEIFTDSYLPHGILNKNKTGCGGTTVVLDSPLDYIVFVPTIELIKNKTEQYGKKAETSDSNIYIIPCYGDITNDDIREMIKGAKEDSRPVKIMATYNSFERLKDIPEVNFFQTKILVDEFHDLMISYKIKFEIVEKLLNTLANHHHVTYMSATPLDAATCPTQINTLNYTEIIWEEPTEQVVGLVRSEMPYLKLSKIINLASKDTPLLSYECQDSGKKIIPDQFFVFINNVAQIRKTIERLKYVKPDEIRIVCSNNSDNNNKLGDLADRIGSISDSLKYNFITRRAFCGCDVYSERGMSIIVTNEDSTPSLLDVTIDIKQIIGRIRTEKNPFRNTILHICKKSPFDCNTERLLAEIDKSGDLPNNKNSEIYKAYKTKLIVETYVNANALKQTYENAEFDTGKGFIESDMSSLAGMDTNDRFEDLLKELCVLFSNGNFGNNIPSYLDHFYVTNKDIVDRALSELGCKKLKTLSYERKKIENALDFHSTKTQQLFKAQLEEKIEIGKKYSKIILKEIVSDIFQESGIQQSATAKYIENFFNTKRATILSAGKRDEALEIISLKP